MQQIASPPALPDRPHDAHKGTFGRVLVIAGSRGMSGASILAGSGALRGGARRRVRTRGREAAQLPLSEYT